MCCAGAPRIGGTFCDSAWERENICHRRVATSVIFIPRSPYNKHRNYSKPWFTSSCNTQIELSCVKACITLGLSSIDRSRLLCLFQKNDQCKNKNISIRAHDMHLSLPLSCFKSMKYENCVSLFLCGIEMAIIYLI